MVVLFTIGYFASFADAEEEKIPNWIKLTAGYWIDGEISDDEFITALQFLVSKGILTIPSDTDVFSQTILDDNIAQPTHFLYDISVDSLDQLIIKIAMTDDSGRTPTEGKFVAAPGKLHVKINDAYGKSLWDRQLKIGESMFKWENLGVNIFGLSAEKLNYQYIVPASAFSLNSYSSGKIMLTYTTDSGIVYQSEDVVDIIPTTYPKNLQDYVNTAISDCCAQQTDGRITYKIESIGNYEYDGNGNGITEKYVRIDLSAKVTKGTAYGFEFNPTDFVLYTNAKTYYLSPKISNLSGEMIGETFSKGIILLKSYPTGKDIIFGDTVTVNFSQWHDGLERQRDFSIRVGE